MEGKKQSKQISFSRSYIPIFSLAFFDSLLESLLHSMIQTLPPFETLKNCSVGITVLRSAIVEPLFQAQVGHLKEEQGDGKDMELH